MKDILKIVLLAVVIGTLYWGFTLYKPQEALKGYGFQGTMATSSFIAVDSTAIEVFDATQCTSRVISTAGSDIMISFDEVSPYAVASTTISGLLGHIQSASTTVAYDSTLYGCGKLSIEAVSASTITVAEFR